MWSSLKGLVDGKAKPESKETALGRVAIKIPTENLLIYRVSKIEDTVEKEGFNDKIDEQIKYLDKLIDEVGQPWGEGADDEDFLWRYGAWKHMIARYNSMAAHYAIKEGEDLKHNEERRQTLRLFAWKQVIPFGWIVIARSMKQKHITPHEPIVIQSNLREGTGGFGFFDPSGGRRSGEGQQEGSPATMENKV